MALSNCPECGWIVSTRAKACPHCGHPVESTPGCGCCLAKLAILVIAAGFLYQALAERGLIEGPKRHAAPKANAAPEGRAAP